MAGTTKRRPRSKGRRRSRYGPGEWFLAVLGLAVIVMVVGMVVSAVIR